MGLKHQARFTDINGDSWFVLIYDEDYGGATIFEFVLGPTGFRADLGGRRERPVRGHHPVAVQHPHDGAERQRRDAD
jgi:hypothetical protein